MKSGYNIEWTDEALQNLDLIIAYLLNGWSEKILEKFAKKLDKRIITISRNPFTFPVSGIRKNVRRCVLSKQTTIYYEIKKDVVVILTLFDNRSDPNSLKI